MSTSTYKKGMFVGLGIIFGAVVGTMIFLFTNQAWHIGVGVSIGLILGAIFDVLQTREFDNSEGHAAG
ncbi:hypothetical protein EU537_03040 [Candidatus Thorarchaeota archaeon]|nr:MAG: hypothetical protein EU537_03040 [Candidatus Thorarchaeota archaeon]